MSATRQAGHMAGHAETAKPVQWLGRFGDACYGLVYIVVAWLALQIAFGDKATEADQRGAVTAISAQPFGSVLLWIVAIGLIAFGVWQALLAISGYHYVNKKSKRTGRRLSSAGRALVVFTIAAFTLRLLITGSGGGSGDSGQQQATAQLLSLPGGRILVFVLGLAVIVAAFMSGRRGTKSRFMEDLDMSGASKRTRTVVNWLGTAGFLAKGVAYAVIGILLCVAAVQLNPSQAGGLDKALRTLSSEPFGDVLLVLVAIGFAAFGAFCFADGRYRRN